MTDLSKPPKAVRSRFKKTLLILWAMVTIGSIAYLIWPAFTALGIDAPQRPDWKENEEAFNSTVATLPPAPSGNEWLALEVPPKIGNYDISRAARVRSGALFYDAYGCDLMNDAGIAYFPEGPDPELANGNFEVPDYKSLGGPWYSFCASW